jgi:alpha-L-fucosidase
MHVHFWPGSTVNLGGLRNKVVSAKLLASGTSVNFKQDNFRVQFVGLPQAAPDSPVTTIAIECDGVPRQDTDYIRKERPRFSANISI